MSVVFEVFFFFFWPDFVSIVMVSLIPPWFVEEDWVNLVLLPPEICDRIYRRKSLSLEFSLLKIQFGWFQDIGLFRLFLFFWDVVVYIFQGIDPFHLMSTFSPFLSLSLVSVVITKVHSCYWESVSFFFISMAKDFSVLFIFSEISCWFHWLCPVVFLFFSFIDFCS